MSVLKSSGRLEPNLISYLSARDPLKHRERVVVDFVIPGDLVDVFNRVGSIMDVVSAPLFGKAGVKELGELPKSKAVDVIDGVPDDKLDVGECRELSECDWRDSLWRYWCSWS